MARVKSHVIQFVAQLEETSLIIVTTSTENTNLKNSFTGQVEGTELLWMRMRRCCTRLCSMMRGCIKGTDSTINAIMATAAL